MSNVSLPPGYGKKVRFAFVVNCLQSFLVIPVFLVAGLVFFTLINSTNSAEYATPETIKSPFSVILLTIVSILILVYAIIVLFIGRAGIEGDSVNLDKMKKAQKLSQWILFLPLIPVLLFILFTFLKQDTSMLVTFTLLTVSTSLINYIFVSHVIKSSIDPTLLWTRYNKIQKLLDDNARAQWEKRQAWEYQQQQQQQEWERRNGNPPR